MKNSVPKEWELSPPRWYSFMHECCSPMTQMPSARSHLPTLLYRRIKSQHKFQQGQTIIKVEYLVSWKDGGLISTLGKGTWNAKQNQYTKNSVKFTNWKPKRKGWLCCHFSQKCDGADQYRCSWLSTWPSSLSPCQSAVSPPLSCLRRDASLGDQPVQCWK
jgi:hypothetical protein